MNTAKTLKKEIINKLDKLNPDEQRSVLELMQSFQDTKKKGTSGKDLIPFAGSIPKSDLEEIEKIIEQDCEKINGDEW